MFKSKVTPLHINDNNRCCENLLNFYRVVMNQSLFDMKRIVDDMNFIDNAIAEPESYKKDFLTVSTLINTYLGVCETVSKIKEDINYGQK